MILDRFFQAASNAVSVGIGVFVGLALADVSSGEEWLLKWSTLIAGILAVVAAFVTIFQMQTTDERQGRRHEELLGLTIRADKLQVEQCADFLNDRLAVCAAKIAMPSEVVRSALQKGVLESNPVALSAYNSMRDELALTNSYLRDEIIGKTTWLMSGKTVMLIRFYMDDTGLISHRDNGFRSYLNGQDLRSGEELRPDLIADLIPRLARLPNALEELRQELRALADSYSVRTHIP